MREESAFVLPESFGIEPSRAESAQRRTVPPTCPKRRYSAENCGSGWPSAQPLATQKVVNSKPISRFIGSLLCQRASAFVGPVRPAALGRRRRALRPIAPVNVVDQPRSGYDGGPPDVRTGGGRRARTQPLSILTGRWWSRLTSG